MELLGNKWTTTVNCSSLLHALWLILFQQERFFELHRAGLYLHLITDLWECLDIRHTNIEWVCVRSILRCVYCHYAAVQFIFCWILHHFGHSTHKHTHKHLCHVAYCKHHTSFPPTPSFRGHEKCWLNPFFVPTLVLRVKAGSEKKEPLFLPQRCEQKGLGLGKRVHTHTTCN